MGVINRRFIPSVKIDKALQRIHSDEWCSWQPSLMIQYQTVQRNCTWTRNICNVCAKLWWIIFSTQNCAHSQTQKYQPFLPIRQYYSENVRNHIHLCVFVGMWQCHIVASDLLWKSFECFVRALTLTLDSFWHIKAQVLILFLAFIFLWHFKIFHY